jgi:hypothetical protein
MRASSVNRDLIYDSDSPERLSVETVATGGECLLLRLVLALETKNGSMCNGLQKKFYEMTCTFVTTQLALLVII